MRGGWSDGESDRSRMGLKGKSTNLTDLDTINPDRRPSTSKSFSEDRGRDVIWILEVAGLGVLVLRAVEDPNDKPKLKDEGLSTFTVSEIASGRVHV